MDWYALHVRSNFEGKVQDSLQQLGIHEFSPFEKVKSRFAKGGVLLRPLLPGYVFAELELEKQRIPVLQITGVVRIVGFGLTPAPIPEGEVEALMLLLASGVPLKRAEYHAEKGQEVEITCGPLTGKYGIVRRLKGKCRVVLSVHALQQSVQAEVDASWLRPAKKAA